MSSDGDRALEAEAALPWDLGQPPLPPTVVTGAPHWQPPRNSYNPGPPGAVTIERFTAALRQAGILDHEAIQLSGATVTLPYGMRIMQHFDAIVRRVYESCGYEEYDYPLLLPAGILDPSRQLLPLGNSLIYAGDDADWSSGRRRMVLSPTGESAVYTHWSQMVRSRADLPIRAYRRTRYYRPSRSGRSVFRAIEATDVYEFQACFADRDTAEAGFASGAVMARELVQAVHVPTLWGTRPPWTNNTAVADTTIGGDVPLPQGSTIQVGSIYQQGTRFSRHYNVSYRDDDGEHHTHHVTGALTRRLVLMHLLLGMDAEGDLLVHPDLSPLQVAMTICGGDPQETVAARALEDQLTRAGVRCRLHILAHRKEIGRLHNRWRQQGVPLRVYLQPRRSPEDQTRAIVVRADTRWEYTQLSDDLANLSRIVPGALKAVGDGYLARTRDRVQSRCRQADRQEEAREVMASRSVAVAPLRATRAAVEAVASWGLGEVLSFRRLPEPLPCVVTGEPTSTSAYLSSRR